MKSKLKLFELPQNIFGRLVDVVLSPKRIHGLPDNVLKTEKLLFGFLIKPLVQGLLQGGEYINAQIPANTAATL